MKITFHGAAEEVTGSQHLIECGKLRFLLDCGLFQGHRAEARQKNEQFSCNPRNLDAVILSHAHIDHCGNLPGLVKAGFDGPIFCTPATLDIAEIMLYDAAHIQEEDAFYLNKHLPPGGRKTLPLYDERDVRRVIKMIQPIRYNTWEQVAPELRIRFRDAGHILGSAITEMELLDKGENRRVVFTGDLGRREMPLLRDPELVPGCDILITECTYGDRIHPPSEDIKGALKRIITETAARNGRLLIPAFSLGRTQSILYFLNELYNEKNFPHVPVYVDSPLSKKITNVYRHHLDVMDEEVRAVRKYDSDPLSFRGLSFVADQNESIALNHTKGPMVVISASGMCESGRILHHLKHSVGNPDNTILIIGFQAQNTLGRRIVERQPYLRIFNRDYPLKAQVEVLNGLSAHADSRDFQWWFDNMASQTGIGQAFLVHGEQKAATALAETLKHASDEPPLIPKLHQSFEI